MSEKLPYEEQFDQAWDTLPLPDEDMAWKDMKCRLDDDDEEKIVVPPPRKGCGVGAILIGLLLLGGLWFILRPEKWFTKKETETAQQTNNDANNQRDNKENKNEVKNEIKVEEKGESNNNENGTQPDTQDEKIKTTTANDTTGTKLSKDIDEGSTKIETKNPEVNKTARRSEPLTIKNKPSNETNEQQTKEQNAKPRQVKANKPRDVSDTPNKKQLRNIDSVESVSNLKKKDSVENVLNDNVTKLQNDSVNSETKSPISPTTGLPVTDSSKNKTVQPVTPNIDSVLKNKNAPKQKDKEQRPIFFAAGLGLHQQIPIAGQEWTTYGSLGRKGILTDYIPSVNFRMEKQDRWFLQTEFRYGAPQHTKQVTYSQMISIDTFSQTIITNSSVLKKTFYHQVPLTFNYYLVPGWSVGTGLQWNKFHSAVAEQEVKKRRTGNTIDSVISKNTVKVSNDSSSAFTKSWFQGIFQTQYQWKRFSIGARYSFGLQPYLKFTLPNRPLQEEKNSSLQIFLRYELWRSDK